MNEVPDRLGAALAASYPILRPIGSGGMARVYLANDLKHDRLVAVKVLRSEYAATLGSERFLREIGIAAKMTHTHILPVYDSGEADGFLYYVMPYIEGESVRDRLTREKRLPVEDSVQIARQVADALSYAHKRGIVHRDIKPANILLEEGEAVVADFGIARAVSAAGGDKLTASGIIVGTPHYMSPEQGTGEHNLDARSDIYALGCVLYEMVAGRPPFDGPNTQSIITQHLSEPPPSLREARPDTPPWLERVVHTALAKKSEERFPTAEHFSHSLATRTMRRRGFRANLWRRWMARLRRRRKLAYAGLFAALLVAAAYVLGRSGPWGPGDQGGSTVATVAVLPFQNISADGAGYLAAGVTYYLADYLGGVRGLAVVSPESMHRYDREGFPTDSIVARHGLDMLIGGSVSVTDHQIEVLAGLTDAASRERIASIEPLERSRAEEALLLRDLAEEVGRMLRRELGNRIERIEAEAVTTCGECLEMVFEARALREQAESLRIAGDSSAVLIALNSADSLLVLAESGDPEWSDPVVERGWVAAVRAGLTGSMRTYDEDWTRVGLGHVERALEIDPSSARAFALRGELRIFSAENSDDADEVELLWEGARSDLEQAVELLPSLATAWSRLSYLYWERGEHERAKSAAERALEEDVWLRNDAKTMIRLCQAVLELEQFQEVSHWCIEEGRLRFPSNPTFVYTELTILASSVVNVWPDVNRAWGLADSTVQLMSPQRQTSTRLWVDMDVAAVLARAGLEDSARAVIRRTRAASPEENPRLDYHEANAWLQLEEIDEALRLLERHLTAWPHNKSRIAKDWWFKPLRENSIFKAIVAE